MVDDQGRSLTGVTEGAATVYFPADSPEEVFYNPGKKIALLRLVFGHG